MRRDTLPTVTLRGRHAGELLAHPCACGHPQCTIGEHIYDSTRDMAPGPKAQSFEPAMARGVSLVMLGEEDPPQDRTAQLWQDYQNLLTAYLHAADDLTRFIDAHRPDRWLPLPGPASDEDWCRNHLEVGICEPRHRGDLCRWCYEIGRTYGTQPDAQFMLARRTRGYMHDRDLNDWLTRRPKTAKAKKRKKAS